MIENYLLQHNNKPGVILECYINPLTISTTGNQESSTHFHIITVNPPKQVGIVLDILQTGEAVAQAGYPLTSTFPGWGPN